MHPVLIELAGGAVVCAIISACFLIPLYLWEDLTQKIVIRVCGFLLICGLIGFGIHLLGGMFSFFRFLTPWQ